MSSKEEERHPGNSALVFVPGFTSKSVKEYAAFLTHKRKNMEVFPFVEIYLRATDRFGDENKRKIKEVRVSHFVELLEEFVHEERLEERFEYVDYCGHSFGGGIVLNAAKASHKVDKVVAINPLLKNDHGLVTMYSVGFAGYLGSKITSLKSKNEEDALDKIVRKILKEGEGVEKINQESEEYKEVVKLYEGVVDVMMKREQAHPRHTESPLASYPCKEVAHIVSNYEYTRGKFSRDTEVLLLYGSEDKYFKPKPKYRENLESRIPSLAAVEVMGGDHHSGYRNRKAITIIERFLKGDLDSMRDYCFPEFPGKSAKYRSDRRILLRDFKKPD